MNRWLKIIGTLALAMCYVTSVRGIAKRYRPRLQMARHMDITAQSITGAVSPASDQLVHAAVEGASSPDFHFDRVENHPENAPIAPPRLQLWSSRAPPILL